MGVFLGSPESGGSRRCISHCLLCNRHFSESHGGGERAAPIALGFMILNDKNLESLKIQKVPGGSLLKSKHEAYTCTLDPHPISLESKHPRGEQDAWVVMAMEEVKG